MIDVFPQGQRRKDGIHARPLGQPRHDPLRKLYVSRRAAAPDSSVSVPLPPSALDAKIAACRAYETQLDFQFGGVEAMEVILRSANREAFSSTEPGTPLLAALLT